MKRLLWFFPLFALAACIVVPVQRRPIVVESAPPPAAPPPVAPLQVWYYGEHFIPEGLGGGA